MQAMSEAEEAAARAALVAAWEAEYAATISHVAEKLEVWKQTYGRHYAVHLYKDPSMEEEVDKARTVRTRGPTCLCTVYAHHLTSLVGMYPACVHVAPCAWHSAVGLCTTQCMFWADMLQMRPPSSA
jgi:hypothetical protein